MGPSKRANEDKDDDDDDDDDDEDLNFEINGRMNSKVGFHHLHVMRCVIYNNVTPILCRSSSVERRFHKTIAL